MIGTAPARESSPQVLDCLGMCARLIRLHKRDHEASRARVP